MTEPPDRRQRMATGALFSVLVLFSGALQALFESSEGPLRWVFLFLASLLVGLIPFTPSWQGIYTWMSRWRTVRWRHLLRRGLVWTLAMAGTVALGAIAVPLAADFTERARVRLQGCPNATQLIMVAAPEDVTTARELASAFEADTAGRRYGCPSADIQVYPETPALVRQALQGGWSPDDLRSIGARPDLWLPGSTRQALMPPDPLVPADESTIASTPIVLAVPPSLLVDPRLLDLRRSLLWSTLIERAEALHWTVQRPDPQLSAAAELATVKLYTDGSVLIDRAKARQLEKVLLPPKSPASGVDLLCGQPTSAVIVTEQQMVRYNAGRLDCPRPLAPNPSWRAFYPAELTPVQMPLLRFRWPDAGDDQAREAAEFVRWLGTTAGREALNNSGLRPIGGGHLRDPLSDRYGVLSVSYGREPPAPEVFEAVAALRAQAQRPARILLALDASGSMNQPVSGAGLTRIDLAKQGIVGALKHIGPGDELALWSFQGTGGPTRLTEFAGDGAAVQAALAGVMPSGRAPLYQSIVDGVSALAPPDPDRHTALVVLTDGEDDSGSRISRQQLLDAVKGRGVKVFAVATGEASCATQIIIEVTEQTDGRCFEVGVASLDARLSAMFEVLWGGS
ncbi:vWA domain-containing protein [Rhizocola hellebori]|uniref:vWA domain-containing protein n=1 Tax=Rhizocola hellebori TaxID=1392758 RepID=UPI00194471CD|nr:substrate-binding domain-containing protein [Rhizocola hellebori]